MNDNEKTTPSIIESKMLLSNMVPDMSYFESRFEIMQNNNDEVRRNQDNFREQLRDMKTDMDRRFTETHRIIEKNNDDFREQLRNIKLDMDRRFNETHTDMKERFAQVDKRFEQVDKRFEQVDKRFEQVDKRFEQVDKRFEQVDKRLDQIISSIEKLGDKMDHRDERQRKFTLRMFSIAISVTGISVFGILIKVLNII